MKLATKFSLTVVGALVLGALGSIEALLIARKMGSVLDGMITDNVSSVRAAEELEISLLEQRGLVSSYILDHRNPRWLDELQRKKVSFASWQVKAEATAHTQEERKFLGDLRDVYQDYDRKRDEVISLSDSGEGDRATAVLLGEVNALYDRAYQACEGFLAANERYIDQRSNRARRDLRQASTVVAILLILTLACGGGLLVLFFRGVLRPLRQMADDARVFSGIGNMMEASASPQDELRAVGYYLRSLMSDVTETQSQLERSRHQLLDSEKLASLGRLAASIGHEIRNPLTSIEMRLYSIRRAVGESPELEDDLRVVSDEIAHLENTIRTFLEFSRPPQPIFSPQTMTGLLDKTLELCGPWLAEREIKVIRHEEAQLPLVTADAGQIKGVFLNLLRNAAEAMEGGGTVEISALPGADRAGRPMVVVRVHDTGPGIAPEVRARILEPFFSTKPQGAGLGLCIAARILAQHNGRLELEPPSEGGACFAIWLPAVSGV